MRRSLFVFDGNVDLRFSVSGLAGMVWASRLRALSAQRANMQKSLRQRF